MADAGAGKNRIFICILGGIVLIHILGIALVVGSSRSSDQEQPVQKQEQPAQKAVPKTSQPAPKAEKRGFWSWLTGSKKPVKPAPVSESPQAPAPPKPVYRYRKLSANPHFGKSFDFSEARRGAMPVGLVPGDRSTAAILVDMDSRKVLWEKNSHQMVPIASMSKMMTILLTMEHLEKMPQMSLSTVVPISKAVLQLPSREGIVWLDPREKFPLSDLIKCTAIKSANDAALQLALVVSGTEENFVSLMNTKAKELGMANTRFINAHGLPTKQREHSLSSAHDMVRLGERLLEYPQIMAYFVTPVATIREGDKKTVLRNTNRLIYKTYSSAEGMKTGFTRKAGFCLTFSVRRDGRRIMGCVTGFPTAKERDLFCKNVIDWAFAGCPDKPLPRKVVKSSKKRHPARAARPAQNRKNTKR